jgi:hypothetical protein
MLRIVESLYIPRTRKPEYQVPLMAVQLLNNLLQLIVSFSADRLRYKTLVCKIQQVVCAT